MAPHDWRLTDTYAAAQDEQARDRYDDAPDGWVEDDRPSRQDVADLEDDARWDRREAA